MSKRHIKLTASQVAMLDVLIGRLAKGEAIPTVERHSLVELATLLEFADNITLTMPEGWKPYV